MTRSAVTPSQVSRRVLLAAAAGGSVAGLAGCVGLAGSGPVQTGAVLGGANPRIPITVFPRLPATGAPPEQVVLGFLASSGVPGPNYGIARAYLTDTAAEDWDPTVGVTVYDGSLRSLHAARDSGAAVSAATTVALEAPTVGALDRHGSWSKMGKLTLPVTMHLRKVAGEWRIQDPPAGLLVSEDDFNQFWLPYRLLFFDPTGDVLVPDPIYLPDRGAAVPDLVQALVDGPSAWLAPVVRSAIPAKTAFTSATVDPTDGQTTVVLDRVAALSTQALTRLTAQLVQTLAQVSSVVTVSIVVNGVLLALPGVAAQQPVDSWPQYSADVLTTPGGDLSVLRPGPAGAPTELLTGDPGTLRELKLPTQLAKGPRPASVGTDPQSSQLVFVDSTQTRVWQVRASPSTAAPVLLASGTALQRPQIDRTGLVWVLDQPGGASRVRALGPGLAAREISVDPEQLPGAQVRRVVLARDGQRAAVVLRSGGQEQLLLELVLRTGTLRLESPRSVLGPVSRILDVAWASSVLLVALLRDADGTVSAVFVNCDGSDQVPLGSLPADSVTVTAGPGSRPPVVGTSAGVLLAQLDAPTWTREPGINYAPVFPG